MSRRGTLWFGWALALVVMACFARLGFWQYGRMQEKQHLLAQVASALNAPARGLDSNATGLVERVEGDARMLAPTLLLDNQMHDGRPGVRVYCIVQTDAAATHRLVDFGWLPLGGERKMPEAKCPTGRVHISGLSTPLPSSGLKLGPPLQSLADGRWLMTRVDPQAIEAATKIEVPARVVRLDPALKMGWTRDLDVLPNTLPPERHLGYAVQWWALCLAVFITALVLSIRKKKPRA